MAKAATDVSIDDKVHEFRRRLISQELPPYRSVDGDELPWQESPAGTDLGLERFLVARKGSIASAVKMYRSHLEWRRKIMPIPKQGRVAQIIEDGKRFSVLKP